jgi:hypothetical protein
MPSSRGTSALTRLRALAARDQDIALALARAHLWSGRIGPAAAIRRLRTGSGGANGRQLGVTTAIPVLCSLVGYPSWRVRIRAVEALATLFASEPSPQAQIS